MTAKELLKPRFKLIADFPNKEAHNIKAVGDVFTDIGNKEIDESLIKDQNGRAISIIDFKKYPHLFKEMKWWEEREESDMPKKLRTIDRDREVYDIYEIEEWNMAETFGYVSKEERRGCQLRYWNEGYGYIPID